MSLVIRAGTSADDAICGRMAGAAARSSTYAARLPHARTLLEKTSPFDLDGRLRMVAEFEGRPIGFADYTIAKGHVKFLFIDPAAQGIGAGTALLNAIQEQVSGPISVHVLTVNDIGILWYLSRGFRVVDGWAERFEGKDAAWLRLVRDITSW
ncbi:MAG: hypothetical protein CMM47_02175 [Rhodospirillaceae bacterium]|nr:hypothetical protein [Rhodospirillaceae bacterium]